MKCKFLLLIGLLFSASAMSSEPLSINYQLSAKHGVDLSVFRRGPLKLDPLQDTRPNYSGAQIDESRSLDTTVSELVTEAIKQGFKQGGATLASNDAKQNFGGQVIELTTETIDNDGSKQIQATIRAKLQLKAAGSGKTYWQSTIFGRAKVDEKEGVGAAIQQALDKFVVSLFIDDYFLIELIE